jgi:glycosyltransferase involved in cell wall biosynthesis
VVKQLRVAVLFDNFGPYHLARLRAASSQVELLAIEVHGRSREYAWEASQAKEPFERVTLLAEAGSGERGAKHLQSLVNCHLHTFKPAAVFLPGWSSRAAFCGMQWCVANAVPAVLMSESTAQDEARSGWREAVKRRYVGLASAALAGGTLHADYLAELGMPRERIFLGYDAVDNAYFAEQVDWLRAAAAPGAGACPCFLASARFIAKKNLPLLLRAYARYRHLSTALTPVWNLVLLGDGPLRAELEALRAELKLQDCVELPGFKQYDQLPAYYARAGAFVHASTTEQWGLVVNEAMASGLPVLVSNRCGCAPDLVRDGVNGWTFDPTNEEQLAELMLKLSTLNSASLSTLGAKSVEIISAWGPDRFAAGLRQAAECAVRVEPKRAGIVDRALLALLARR